MPEFLQTHLEWWALLLAMGCGLLIGFSKTALPGAGMLIVPMLAMLMPARDSVGTLTPLLIIGDTFAVIYYHRHAEWRRLLSLMPWIAGGIIIAWIWVLPQVKDNPASNHRFALVLGILVLILGLLEFSRRRWIGDHVPHGWWFVGGTGLLAGVTTTVGNAAGPVMGIYFLSQQLEKAAFMGNTAWLFFLVNCSKIPVYVQSGWISQRSIAIDLCVGPLVIVGAFTGAWALPKISQRRFNGWMLGLTLLAALTLVLRALLGNTPAPPANSLPHDHLLVPPPAASSAPLVPGPPAAAEAPLPATSTVPASRSGP